MFKVASNLTMMFKEVEFSQRFEKAAKSGFSAVEMLWPYELAKADLKKLLDDNGLKLALFNTKGGDTANGQWGRAAIPGGFNDAKEDIDLALDYAVFAGCKTVHVMSAVVKGFTKEAAYDALAKSVEYAAAQAKPHGITITLEALCPEVKPDYLYKSQYETLAFVNKVNLDNVKVQFDFYHAQMVDGGITKFLKDNIAKVGHVQIASVPDRHEFDHGELDGAYCLKLLNDLNYEGFVGCEYNPQGITEEGLTFLSPYLKKPA